MLSVDLLHVRISNNKSVQTYSFCSRDAEQSPLRAGRGKPDCHITCNRTPIKLVKWAWWRIPPATTVQRKGLLYAAEEIFKGHQKGQNPDIKLSEPLVRTTMKTTPVYLLLRPRASIIASAH